MLEALAQRCPKDFAPFVEPSVGICLDLITWDPNYNYDSDEEMGGDDDEDEDDGDYSDDDDVSWKVGVGKAVFETKCYLFVHLIFSSHRSVAPPLAH